MGTSNGSQRGPRSREVIAGEMRVVQEYLVSNERRERDDAASDDGADSGPLDRSDDAYSTSSSDCGLNGWQPDQRRLRYHLGKA